MEQEMVVNNEAMENNNVVEFPEPQVTYMAPQQEHYYEEKSGKNWVSFGTGCAVGAGITGLVVGAIAFFKKHPIKLPTFGKKDDEPELTDAQRAALEAEKARIMEQLAKADQKPV